MSRSDTSFGLNPHDVELHEIDAPGIGPDAIAIPPLARDDWLELPGAADSPPPTQLDGSSTHAIIAAQSPSGMRPVEQIFSNIPIISLEPSVAFA